MKLFLKIFIPLCLSFELIAQHNSDYMQYMFNGLLINPAYAGSREALDVTALYRKQWMGMDGSPVTASFGAHAPLTNKKINVGMVLMNDCFGIFNHTRLNLIYAYRFRFLRGHLSFGLQGGVDSYTSNWNRVNTTEKSDPNFMVANDRITTASAGAGTYYYSRKFYFGFAMPELINPAINKYTTMILNSGVLLNLSDHIKIKPAVLAKYITNSPFYLNISSTFYWKDLIGLGIGYTTNTSAMALIDLKLNDQLRFGYGYDYPVNKLKTYSIGSHELMLRYIFKYKLEPLSTRYF